MTREIDQQQVAAAVADGGFVIDVRQPEEYEGGHVPGARLIPLAIVPLHVDRLPRDRTVHVICRTGARSAQAVAWLRRAGVDAVNVLGGTQAWAAAGRPVAHGQREVMA